MWKGKAFWLKTLERAVKTAAQFTLGAITGSVVGPVAENVNLDWQLALGAAGAGFVVSVLTSIASAPIGEDKNSPSLV